MKKPISVRRQKRTKDANPFVDQTTKDDSVDDQASSNTASAEIESQHLQLDANQTAAIQPKLLLEKVEALAFEQLHSQSALFAIEQNQEFLQQKLLDFHTAVTCLQQNQTELLSHFQILSSQLENLAVFFASYTDLTTVKNMEREDYRAILDILLKQKQAQDTERTLSFQLGKLLLDGSKNINNAITLPKKLFDLRKESLRRKEHKQNLKNERLAAQTTVASQPVNPSRAATEIKTVQKLSLEQLLSQNKKDHFHGDLSNYLIFKNHEMVEFTRLSHGLEIKSKAIMEQPRYFYSNNMLSLEQLQPYIHQGKMTLLLQYEQADLNVELMIHYLDDARQKINFNIAKPAAHLYFNVPENAQYIHLGLKISGHGYFCIQHIHLAGLEQHLIEAQDQKSLVAGISIIIPSYQGHNTILETLNSIKYQKNISLDLIEIICVINGPRGKTEKVIRGFVQENPDLSLKILYSDIASASHARNVGLENISREFLVFLDDDDIISANYLSDMYALSDSDTVVFSYIHDLNHGEILKETSISQQLIQNKNNLNLNGLSSAITMIASKMLPSKNVQQLKFDPQLKSGEDVSFFVEYMLKFNPQFKLVENEDCAYIRRITENSVSRQPMSFHFNVEQRLDVIKSLDVISTQYTGQLDGFVASKMKAQIGFIVRYLEAHPQDLDLVIAEIIQRKIHCFPYAYFWEKLGKNKADQLIFSYCHPPFVDTSATIVGKRVQEFGLLSDVIANDMSGLRKVDPEMMFLNRHLIRDIQFLQTETSFGGWWPIKAFAEQANLFVADQFYPQIYSRVLWPGSNFAAAQYKLRHRQTKWIAEFSDPAILDIKGEERLSVIDDQQWIEQILQGVSTKLRSILSNENNLYVWCELLAYLFADEVIFTCENQRRLMLERFKYQEIAQSVYAKSVIKPHPTLPQVFYQLGQTRYELDADFIHIAYFGVFYANRNLDDFILAIQQVNQQRQSKRKIKLHIFTHSPEDFTDKYGEDIIFNAYLGYFDFLAISNHFDYLLVNDAVVCHIFGINPYLPSKVSDYKGARAQIIALVENGSALSKMENIPIKLRLGSEHLFSHQLLTLIDSEAV